MKLPQFQPEAVRGGLSAIPKTQSIDGLTLQGCSIWKKIGCGAAVATCLATPNPVACIMAAAPSCVDCL
jgi:hypothetical protein